MSMEEIIKKLYSCDICQKTCLKDWTSFRFPEPFLGSLHPSFVIVGINPSEPSPAEHRAALERKFKDEEGYLSYYLSEEGRKVSEDDLRVWARGYLEAYRMLVDKESTLDDFNKDAMILNVIKCPTKSIREIPENAIETARVNCLGYLIGQLIAIQPKIVLSHSKFPCKTIMKMLEDGTNYKVDTESSSCGVDDLAKLRLQQSMTNVSREKIIAKSQSGDRTLFLFTNLHLSRWMFAKKSLNTNIEEKRKIIEGLR